MMEIKGQAHSLNLEVAQDLIYKASIAKNGAVLLGENAVCDAHAERPIRVVTHAHRDHIPGLEQSIRTCEVILMSRATRDILRILKPGRWLSSPKIRLMERGEKFDYKGESITFYPSGHMLGSVQVFLKDRDGIEIAHTGDFKLPEAEIIEPDVLVMEATYGNPKHVRCFQEKVEDKLVSLIKEGIEKEPVYIFGYHGKLQEVLGLLRRSGISKPALLEEKVFDVAKVCEKYGMKLGEYSKLDKGIKSQGNKTFLALLHMSSAKKAPSNIFKVFLSGWEFEKSVKQIGEKEYTVAFSDHSDFEGLIEYVTKSKSKLVITDDYRVGDAKALAREVRKRLGIYARALP